MAENINDEVIVNEFLDKNPNFDILTGVLRKTKKQCPDSIINAILNINVDDESLIALEGLSDQKKFKERIAKATKKIKGQRRWSSTEDVRRRYND